MCFYINEKTPELRIAESDITCYKIIKKTWFSFLGFYISIHKGFLYWFKHKFSCKKVMLCVVNDFCIYEGYHSYTTKYQADRNKWVYKAVVKEFVIPKGTTYYIDEDSQEYVSEKILMR